MTMCLVPGQLPNIVCDRPFKCSPSSIILDYICTTGTTANGSLSIGLQDEFIVITENGIRWRLCQQLSRPRRVVMSIQLHVPNKSIPFWPQTDVRLNVLACTRKGTTVGVIDEGGEGGGRRQTYKSGQLSLLNDFNCFPANCNRSRRIECLSPTMYRLPSVWWTIERRHVLVLYLLILDEF